MCLAIVVADALQPVLLPWRPKFVGALLGAAFYGTCAVFLARGHRWPVWGVALLPLVPLSLLGAWSAGLEVPVEPDPMMAGVLVLQLAGAGLAGALLYRTT